ncbi:hypothetical protein OAK75_08785 [Bacteriovoracales bacterium]|nr:hypothetical protein [Bacteriovoracales bacterium]
MDFEVLSINEFIISLGLNDLMKGIPHIIYNNEDKIISRESYELVTKFEKHEIRSEGPSLGVLITVQMPDDFYELFKGLVIYSWQSFYKSSVIDGNLEKRNIMALDYSRFFYHDFLSVNVPFSLLVKKCFCLLKSHISIQEMALFFVDRARGLKEIGRIGGKESPHEIFPLDGKSIESICVLSKRPYYAKNCKEEPIFMHLPDVPYTNYACFPLWQNGKIVGVLSCIDLLKSEWNSHNLNLVKLFGQLLMWMKSNKENGEIIKEEVVGERVFLNYLSKKISSKYEDKPFEIEDVYCLYIDIKGSIDLLKGFDQEKRQALLKVYFDTVLEVAERFEAEVDDCYGDTILLKWNSLGQGPLSKNLVCEAALEIQKVMITSVFPFWKNEGIKRVGVGIGVDGGECCIGNLGGPNDVKFSALGFCVKNSEILGKMAAPGEILIPEGFLEGVAEEDRPGFKRSLSNVHLFGSRKKEKILVIQPIDYPDYTKIKSV